MEPLIIEKTKTTPFVKLDKSLGIFEIGGNSLPENVMDFYSPVIEWIKAYLTNPNPTTELTFKMQYFNTASSKIIFEIIKMHKAIHNSSYDITVNWYHLEEDEDMLEAGQDYADLTKLPFQFKILEE